MLLAAHPEVEVVGECEDGWSAIDATRALEPDLLLLDIQMPELDGFGVLEQLGPDATASVIFVTAHDRYAIKAFEVAAVDYLLKPVDAERLDRAIRRAAETPARVPDLDVAELRRLLAFADGPVYRTRLVVRDRRGAFFLPVNDIERIEAAGNYVRIYTDAASHLVRATLIDVERSLNPEDFVRVNRSAIANVGRIVRIEPWTRGEYCVVLRSGTKLISSRHFGTRFRKLLE
jgi:two-component system LytT family response regulator